MKDTGRAALFALAAVFCAGIPSRAWAWNAAGHRLVAAIAWNAMKPKAREEATRLLRHHPDYPRWLKKAGTEDGRRIFIEASTWPDEIRKDARFFSAGRNEPTPTLPGFPDMERRSDWHYVNRPLDAGSGGKPVSGQIGRRLPELIGILRTPDSDRNPARSYALPWMIHLAGDSHQPLHAGAHPGDAGERDKPGDGLRVRNPFNPRKPVSTLHAFWDDLPGPPWLRGDKLDAAALALAAAHARVGRSLDSERWIKESWRLARDEAYPLAYPATPSGNGALPEITGAFYETRREIAGRRVAQAGFRLAGVLNRSFAARPPAANRRNQR